METFPVCELRALGTTPTVKAENRTISLVLFAHKSGGNLKRYLRGLHLWMKQHMWRFPSGLPITLFVDANLLEEAVVKKALAHRRVRGIAFQCGDYMKDGHFDSLFPTLVRFFPAMAGDGEPLSKCLVHVFDIEPAREDINHHLLFLNLIKRHNENDPGRRVDFFYNSAKNLTTIPFASNDKGCPYVFAGRVTLFRKFESALMMRFLQDMQKLTSIEWYYGIMQTPFCRGVDEVFANRYLLPYFLEKSFTVAYTEDYFITSPLFWWKDMILADKNSAGYLQSILATVDKDLQSLLRKFDKQFYNCERVDQESKLVAKRYFSLLRSLVRSKKSWFPLDFMKYVLRHFQKFVAVNRLVVVSSQKTTYINVEQVRLQD